MKKELGHKKKNILLSIFQQIEIGICVISLLAMTIITGMSVISRYIFGFSFTWSEEVCRFLVVWITFGGSAYAFRQGAHIGVVALVNILPEGIQKKVNIIIKVITIGFFILIGYFGFFNALTRYFSNQLTPATQISVAVPYSAIPIGSILVVIRLIIEIINDIKGRPEPRMEAEL